MGLQMGALGVHLAAAGIVATVDAFLLLLLLLVVVVEVRVGALTNEGTREAATDCSCRGRGRCTIVWGRVAWHVALNGRGWVGVRGSGQLWRVADGDVALWHLTGVSVHHPVNSRLHHCAGVHHRLHGKVLLLAVRWQAGFYGHVVF